MTDKIYEVVAEVVENETGQSLAHVDPNADLLTQVVLDSMQYVSISASIEMALDIELPISVLKTRTLGDFLDIVRAQVTARDALN